MSDVAERARRIVLGSRAGLIAAWLLAFATACGASADPGDSSTHFWGTCGADNQCGAGYQCVCDRCTKACNEDAQCADEGAQCTPASAVGCAVEGNICSAAITPGPADDTDTGHDERDAGPAPTPSASEADAAGPDATPENSASDNSAPDDSNAPTGSEATPAPQDGSVGAPSHDDDVPSQDAGMSMPADDAAATTAVDAATTGSSTWSAPTGLEVGPGSSSWSVVTLDAEGNALFVWLEWEDESDPIYSIRALRHMAGAGWGKTQTVISNDVFIDPPCMKGNPAGSAVAAWSMGELGRSTLWTATFSGDTWSEAAPIALEGGPVGSMDCAIDDEGRAWVAWVQTGSTSAQLSAARFVSDGGWETAEVIGNDEGGASYVSLAIDAQGGALAVWNVLNGGAGSLWANHYDGGAGWQGPALVPAAIAGMRMRHVDVALNAAGDGIATWNELTELANYEWVKAATFSLSDGWGPAATLTETTERTEGLRVGIDSEGAALVLWEGFTQSSLGYENRLLFDRYTPSEGWANVGLIVDDASQVTLSMSSNGRALASWRQPYDPSVDGDIAAAWFDPQTRWDAAETFSADPEGDSLNPSAAVNEAGRAVVVWQQVRGGAQGDLWTALVDE